MTSNIGAPFIPPDEVTISNTNGRLALKAAGTPVSALAVGTQGDILYAGAAGAWAKLSAGTSGQFLKTQGANSNPIWSSAPGEGWIELASYSNATLGTTKTTIASSLTAYDQYLIIGYAEGTCTASYTLLELFINEVTTAAQYIGQQINSANTLSSFSNGAGTGIPIACFPNATADKLAVPVRFECYGKGSAQANGKLGYINQTSAFASGCALSGYFIAGNNTAITSFSMRALADGINVKVKVFGRNA